MKVEFCVEVEFCLNLCCVRVEVELCVKICAEMEELSGSFFFQQEIERESPITIKLFDFFQETYIAF